MGNKLTVNIYVEPKSGGGYSFTMHDGKGSTNELTFNKTRDRMKTWEDYEIWFELNNQNGADLKFSHDMDKVLWAEPTEDPNPPCPTSQQMDGIFYVASQNDIKDLKLRVTNTDPDHQRFVFGFNFLPANENDGPGANYVLYDPIGNNQNGGFPKSFLELNTMTVGGTAIGAVLGSLVAPLFNPAATTMTYLAGAVIGAVVGFVAGLLIGKPSGGSVRSAPHA
jgi:hypothetical protein